MKIINAGLMCLVACAVASPASAQATWTNQGFVNANVGVQVGSQDFTVATPFEIYGEAGSVSSTMDVSGGGLFDVSGGYKVWRNLAVGLGYSFTRGSADAAVSASVPDPLLFDQPRQVSGTAPDLDHQEQALYLTGTWMVPVTEKVDVGLAFGPTIFFVKQEVANGVDVTEPGPSLNRVNVGSIDETAVGIHLGVDVTYLVTPRIGVGGLARYSWGAIDVENASDDLKAGGFQIGAGVRIRF